MLLKEKARKLLRELEAAKSAQVPLGAFALTIQLIDEARQLSLATPVYRGEGYIPQSVRCCLAKSPPPFLAYSALPSELTIDEERFEVILSHVGKVNGLSEGRLVKLLEEFGWLATEWSRYFEQREENDLVHIPVNR